MVLETVVVVLLTEVVVDASLVVGHSGDES